VSDPCNQAKSIFLAAIEEHAPEQWPGFLNQACAGDVRLRAEVEIDTRSDSYSLGMLLYELLAGVTPFDRGRMGTLGYDEMRRVIREEDPPSPSIRLSTLGQAAVTVSAERQSDPKRLCRLLRGELDWIVMKALEKDRTRRYETANELARDVDRYLHDEDVARLRGQGPGDPERLAALLAEQELGEDQVDGGFDAVPDRGEDLEIILGGYPLPQAAPLGLVDPQRHDDPIRVADAGLLQEVREAGLVPLLPEAPQLPGRIGVVRPAGVVRSRRGCPPMRRVTHGRPRTSRAAAACGRPRGTVACAVPPDRRRPSAHRQSSARRSAGTCFHRCSGHRAVPR
jgi:hypothetical protein